MILHPPLHKKGLSERYHRYRFFFLVKVIVTGFNSLINNVSFFTSSINYI